MEDLERQDPGAAEHNRTAERVDALGKRVRGQRVSPRNASAAGPAAVASGAGAWNAEGATGTPHSTAVRSALAPVARASRISVARNRAGMTA